MKFPESLKPYRGIIFFIVALLSAHFFWKLTVIGDENGEQVLFFGLNISQPFIILAAHIARVTDAILHLIGFNTCIFPGNVVKHGNGNAVHIIWGCTGLKQTFIFTVILFFSRGKLISKLWYIFFGWMCIYLFNVFRIIFITALMEKHPEWFNLLHEHLFKYLFYIMIFLIWVYWEEKLADKSTKGENE